MAAEEEALADQEEVEEAAVVALAADVVAVEVAAAAATALDVRAAKYTRGQIYPRCALIRYPLG